MVYDKGRNINIRSEENMSDQQITLARIAKALEGILAIMESQRR